MKRDDAGPHAVDERADVHDLRRALERAQDRLDAATLRAERARRAYFWSDRPIRETRRFFEAAMREEADAILAVEAAQREVADAHAQPLHGAA